MREYLNQQKGVQLKAHAAKSLPALSPALQIEVVLHCHRHWLDAIWFLRNLEEITLVRLAMAMSPKVFSPGEVAPLRVLYVVARGLVLYGVRSLYASNHRESLCPGPAPPSSVDISRHRFFVIRIRRDGFSLRACHGGTTSY